jgi:hypothetical protein
VLIKYDETYTKSELSHRKQTRHIETEFSPCHTLYLRWIARVMYVRSKDMNVHNASLKTESFWYVDLTV